MNTITIYKTKEEQLRILPCIKCGSDDIEFTNHGYTTFNRGTAWCKGCGRKLNFSINWDAHDYDIALIWNRENDLQTLKTRYQNQINELNDQINEIDRLMKELPEEK